MANSFKVTIKDVARACGVSTQTISRVLNNRTDVSKVTREKVLAVIEQMDYQPSALARGMRQMSRTLGVIIAGLKFKGISTTLKGIVQAAEARGFSIILKELPTFGPMDMQPLIQSLISQQVRGIIYAAPQVGGNWASVRSVLTSRTPPMVFLKGNPSTAPMTISLDNYSGGYMLTRHLLEQGYGRIAHVSGPMCWWESTERKRGWSEALRDAGLPAPESACVEGDWSPAGGLSSYRALVNRYPDMDAVFAANDQMALGVLHGVWRDGRSVPGSLGVAGYDDLSESAYFTPALTTVRQDFNKLGELAVRKLMLLAGLAGEDAEVESDAIMLEPTLVVRDSTRKGAAKKA
jgi:DNA-binding LacI/PurR family transcriptional regulator